MARSLMTVFLVGLLAAGGVLVYEMIGDASNQSDKDHAVASAADQVESVIRSTGWNAWGVGDCPQASGKDATVEVNALIARTIAPGSGAVALAPSVKPPTATVTWSDSAKKAQDSACSPGSLIAQVDLTVVSTDGAATTHRIIRLGRP